MTLHHSSAQFVSSSASATPAPANFAPATDSDLNAKAEPGATVPATPHSSSKPSARPLYKVLVIEDDPHIARLVVVNLTRAGLESRLALSGAAGLEAFKEDTPHLVLLDLMMPGLDGFQVCERIRAQSAVPIVIMTARLEPIHQMRGFRLGADDYVLKPFDPQILVARIIAHLRRVYRYNDGRIYPVNKSDTVTSSTTGTQNPAEIPELQNDCSDVLAHMPAGWAGCAACNYMGPLSQFPRRFNGTDTTALTCPNCNTTGHVKFSVDGKPF